MRACRPRRRPFLPRREGRTTRRAAPGETQFPATPRRHSGEKKQAGDPSFLIAGQERRVAVPKRPSGGERRQCGRQKLVSHSEIGFSSRVGNFWRPTADFPGALQENDGRTGHPPPAPPAPAAAAAGTARTACGPATPLSPDAGRRRHTARSRRAAKPSPREA